MKQYSPVVSFRFIFLKIKQQITVETFPKQILMEQPYCRRHMVRMSPMQFFVITIFRVTAGIGSLCMARVRWGLTVAGSTHMYDNSSL